MINFALSFVVGFLIKFADNAIDEKLKLPANIEYVIGLIAGLIWGYLISLDSAIATISFGIIIACFLSSKIDHSVFFLTVAAIIGVTFFLGLPEVNPFLFVIFAFFAWIDEKSDSEISKNKKLNFVLHQRIMSDLSALAVSFVLSNWNYLGFILTFDLGYKLADYLSMKFFRK